MDLFTHNADSKEANQGLATAPLAERLRPKTIQDFLGQNKFSNAELPLFKNLKERNFLPNMILWGPPGSGKTTFAQLLKNEIKAHFVSCNAVETGAKELKEIGAAAHARRLQFQEKTILFIDEIHRLNKSQQDVLLSFTEKGDLTLIGATTENPSYEINSALMSRMQLLVFERLSFENLQTLLGRACELYQVSVSAVLNVEAIDALIHSVSGDARKLLNIFEIILNFYSGPVENANSGQLKKDQSKISFSFPLDVAQLEKINFSQTIRYDKSGDLHYDTISAFIKSVRGSDPDAAIYYLARMLEGGESPVFIARRLVISASEDIGNADPKALPLAIAGLQAVELIGMPEARISLAQVTTYLASAPKSNRSYAAINEALELVRETGALPIPLSLRSAQTQLARSIGHGDGYKYSHDYERGYAEQNFMPDELKDKKFYKPTEHGFEKNIRQYLNWLKNKLD
jgi:putative ATPase